MIEIKIGRNGVTAIKGKCRARDFKREFSEIFRDEQ